MINQNMKVKMAVIIAFIFIAITAQSANALPVTGTAILRDVGNDPAVSPISYYLALPKGTCDIIVSGTFGSDVAKSLLKVNVATANISGTPQNLQTCFNPDQSTTYIAYFSCPATVTVTDALPFLYITFLTDKTPGFSANIKAWI